jgi:hypothetical protein
MKKNRKAQAQLEGSKYKHDLKECGLKSAAFKIITKTTGQIFTRVMLEKLLCVSNPPSPELENNYREHSNPILQDNSLCMNNFLLLCYCVKIQAENPEKKNLFEFSLFSFPAWS